MEAAVAAQPAVTTVTRTYNLPPLGSHWQAQGGIFAGLLRTGADPLVYALIVAPADSAGRFNERTWGEWGKEIDGAANTHDGAGNTAAMAAAGYELAKDILALDLNGHKDWYLPSQAELQLCRVNASEQFEKDEWYWSSTQYSSGNAWAQAFEYGGSYVDGKDNELRAVAVRRLVL